MNAAKKSGGNKRLNTCGHIKVKQLQMAKEPV
jgi:hypothetical protein